MLGTVSDIRSNSEKSGFLHSHSNCLLHVWALNTYRNNCVIAKSFSWALQAPVWKGEKQEDQNTQLAYYWLPSARSFWVYVSSVFSIQWSIRYNSASGKGYVTHCASHSGAANSTESLQPSCDHESALNHRAGWIMSWCNVMRQPV